MIALASLRDIPEMFGVIISHFLSEWARPFYDGNGRTGRYLPVPYLSRPLSTLTVLSASRSIAESRSSYYWAFRVVEDTLNHGKLTHFVLTMLEYVDTAQRHVPSDLEARQGQLEITVAAIDELAKSSCLPDEEHDTLHCREPHSTGRFPVVPLTDRRDAAPREAALGEGLAACSKLSLPSTSTVGTRFLKLLQKSSRRFVNAIHSCGE